MKLFIILNILLVCTFVKCQLPKTLYANFIPYGVDSSCTTNQVIGLGYSFQANNCFYNIAHNGLTQKESSFLVIVDALRVGVAQFDNYNNNSCTGSFVNANSFKNGSCVQTPPFITFNGSVNSYPLSSQYSLVTISDSPLLFPNTQVYSQFDNGGYNGCGSSSSSSTNSDSNSDSGDNSNSDNSSYLYYTTYSTNGLKFSSNDSSDPNSLTIECTNGNAMVLVCKDGDNSSSLSSSSSCIQQDVTMPCTPGDDTFNEVFCTPN
ncbi:hypothetical protein RB653_000959 [Dictyostelium firmibasis]|uniref:Uncharacterized protein n=1 Tax=Dictyostelium firmibasis TaxID=79012 RepID=A0AAN7U360_9MYCE